jgi:hypothetical protein
MRSWLAKRCGVKGASWGARLRQGFGGQTEDLTIQLCERNGAGWRNASGVKGASWGARLRQGFGGQAEDLSIQLCDRNGATRRSGSECSEPMRGAGGAERQ